MNIPLYVITAQILMKVRFFTLIELVTSSILNEGLNTPLLYMVA